MIPLLLLLHNIESWIAWGTCCLIKLLAITEWQQNFDQNRYRDFFQIPNFLIPNFPRPIFSKPKPNFFFGDQNPPKISKSIDTETETETSQYPWHFLERSSPDIFLLYFICFSSPPEKRYSPPPNIFLLFLLLRNRTSTSTSK